GETPTPTRLNLAALDPREAKGHTSRTRTTSSEPERRMQRLLSQRNSGERTRLGRSHDMGNTLKRYVPSVFPSRGRHFDSARPLNSRGKKGSRQSKNAGQYPRQLWRFSEGKVLPMS